MKQKPHSCRAQLASSFLYATRIVFSKNKTNGRKSLFGAMICIGISLIPLIAVLAVSDGMIEGITGRIIGLSTQDTGIFFANGYDEVRSLEAFKAAAAKAKTIEHVTGVYPEVQGTVLVSPLGGKKYRTGATVRAIDENMFEQNQSFKTLFAVYEGETAFKDEKHAIVCKKMADDLGVKAGDRISMIAANVKSNGMIIPKTAVFTVGGIVSCGYQELDALWIFIPLKTGFDFIPANAASYSLNLTTDGTFTNIPQKVKAMAREHFPFAGIWTWNEQNASQFENFSSTRILLLLIMLLIILVASVNISSALVMVVMERLKEIAILKSVGASPQLITTAFLMAGFACGLGGVAFGLPLGILAAVNINPLLRLLEKITNLFGAGIYYILHFSAHSSYSEIKLLDPAYYLQDIPPSLSAKELLVIAVGTLLLSLLVSFIPALKAGKEKPLDTLRKA